MRARSLISATILVAFGWVLPSHAAGLVSSYVVERGESGRVKEVPGSVLAADAATLVDIRFGMGRAASEGFVAASGRAGSEVRVSRGARGVGGSCLPEVADGGVVRLR